MKLKVPAFLTRRPAFLTRKATKPRPPLKLRAATASRRMSPAMDDDMDDEPTTRLSSAFFVVLILHLVAVGGIWAFNSIKAHRRGVEPASAAAAPNAGLAASSLTAPTSSEPARGNATSPGVQSSALTAAVKSSGSTYEVKPNDTLGKIAGNLGVSLAELQAANDAKEIAVLHPGQILNVPKKTGAQFAANIAPKKIESTPAQKKPESTPVKRSVERSHKVEKGDTLTYLAKRYGSTVDELVKMNKIKDPKRLQLGQVLKMPAK